MSERPYYSCLGMESLEVVTDPEERKPHEEDMALSVRQTIERARQNVPDDKPGPADLKSNTRLASSRLTAEKEMILTVRSAANLLKDSLQADMKLPFTPAWRGGGKEASFPSSSFGSFLIPRGIMLGGDACHEIGVRVCDELNFTVAEADELLTKYPKPDMKPLMP